MGINTTINLSCDLCKWPAKTFKNATEAREEGWIVVGQESYYDDRSFYDTWICPFCIKKIRKQLNAIS